MSRTDSVKGEKIWNNSLLAFWKWQDPNKKYNKNTEFYGRRPIKHKFSGQISLSKLWTDVSDDFPVYRCLSMLWKSGLPPNLLTALSVKGDFSRVDDHCGTQWQKCHMFELMWCCNFCMLRWIVLLVFSGAEPNKNKSYLTANQACVFFVFFWGSLLFDLTASTEQAGEKPSQSESDNVARWRDGIQNILWFGPIQHIG